MAPVLQAARSAVARLLPALLALSILDWGAASLVPPAVDPLDDGIPGAAVAAPLGPAVLAAAPRTMAAKPRGSEKTTPPIDDGNAVAGHVRPDPAGSPARPTFRRIAEPGPVPVLIRPFDARAPPTA